MRERTQWSVREAIEGDAERLRSLLRQLGYDVSAAHVAAVLRDRGPSHEVFVAVIAGAGVVGLVETMTSAPSLADAGRCEVAALVVEDEFRSCGIGEALIARAQDWAAQRGASRVRVRTNVVRERAHGFYERLGFERVKAQHVFEKKP